MQESLYRLSYLLEVHSFNEEEMEMNKVTLLWPKSLDPIFDENERVGCHVIDMCLCVRMCTHVYVCTLKWEIFAA